MRSLVSNLSKKCITLVGMIKMKRKRNNEVQRLLYKRKKVKRVKRFRVFLVFCFIVLVSYYFISDYSKVNHIEVVGNSYIEQLEIVESSGLVAGKSFDLFTFKSTIEQNVLAIKGIKDVKVTRDYRGSFCVEVVEDTIVGYHPYETEVGLVMSSGDVVYIDLGILSIGNYVELMNFSKSLLEQFSEQYILIPIQVRNLISDIAYVPASADETRCEFYMNDGKVVIVRIEDMASQLAGDNYAKMIRTMPDNKYYDLLGKYGYVFD